MNFFYFVFFWFFGFYFIKYRRSDEKAFIVPLNFHIATVEKSMNQIVALGKEVPVNYNQLVRPMLEQNRQSQVFGGEIRGLR